MAALVSEGAPSTERVPGRKNQSAVIVKYSLTSVVDKLKCSFPLTHLKPINIKNE
jgi:hypothetical protein